MAGILGFDVIWLDLEHHGTSVETASHLMRSARAGGTEIMVRPAKGEFMRMGRLLEVGANAIMYPRCDGPEEAAEVVRWTKFPPMGERGFDGGNADQPYLLTPAGDYMQNANNQTAIVIQLEHQAAVDNAQAIAEVDGVDVIFFGPADFTASKGIFGQLDHPDVENAMRRVSEAAKRAGKHWGMSCGTPEMADKAIGMGARFISRGSDIVWVKQGLQRMRDEFSKLGFTFDPKMGY